ncbi:MAG: hypothetical protein V4651_06920, partial [Bacteroidota bacterium]
MKSSRYLICYAMLMLLGIQGYTQICTPDTTIPYSQGMFPGQLPDAHHNLLYTEVIQFKAPLDTNIFYQPLNSAVSFRVDSLLITAIVGLPSGISYQCNTPQCIAKGGAVG